MLISALHRSKKLYDKSERKANKLRLEFLRLTRKQSKRSKFSDIAKVSDLKTTAQEKRQIVQGRDHGLDEIELLNRISKFNPVKAFGIFKLLQELCTKPSLFAKELSAILVSKKIESRHKIEVSQCKGSNVLYRND